MYLFSLRNKRKAWRASPFVLFLNRVQINFIFTDNVRTYIVYIKKDTSMTMKIDHTNTY